MRKVIFPLVLAFVLIVAACVPTPAPTAPTAAVVKLPNPLQFDWVVLYSKVEGSVFLVWGEFGTYNGPNTPGQSVCPNKEDGVKILLCEIKNVRRNGVLDLQTKDTLPSCKTGQTTQSTPLPPPLPGVQTALGKFFALYQCRDEETSQIWGLGEPIERQIWAAGHACPQEAFFEGRGPFKLIFCYPLDIIPFVPTPTPTRRPSI